MHSEHTREEEQEIEKQTQDLLLAWNELSDRYFNGDVHHGEHPPPALMSIYEAILTTHNPLQVVSAVSMGMTPDGLTFGEALTEALGQIIAYGDTMFRFAQFCTTRGLLHANLVPCNCNTVSDEELRKWLGTPYKGGAEGGGSSSGSS